MSYFIFKGQDSRDFGILHGLPIPPLPERTLHTDQIPGRYEPMNTLGIERMNITLSFTLGITSPDKAREIYSWLQGSGDLILSNDLTKKYRAFVHASITPERLSRRFGNIPITFTCAPYAYAVTNPFVSVPMNFTDTGADTSVSILSNGTAESEPLWFFAFAGKLKITLNDTDDPLIIDLPGHYSASEYSYFGTDPTPYWHYKCEPDEIYVDTASRLAYRLSENGEKTVVTDLTSGRFPELSPGINTVRFELSNERWEHDGRTYIRSDQQLISFGYRKNERWY